MLYFIPAWDKKKYREQEQNWYSPREHTEFDDTVKHVQLYHRNHICPYYILLLHYAPNFRHFLHRQSVFHAPYWSVFDAIQEVESNSISVFSFHDLLWPEHIEFMYTPFCVIALLNHEKYAEIHFAEDGNMYEVDLFKNGLQTRKNVYDDRGFVSSTVLYKEGKAIYEQYLGENGIWKMTQFYEDGHVAINPKNNTYVIQYKDTKERIVFNKMKYTSIEEVLQEVVQMYISKTNENDIFYVAMDDHHPIVLKDCLMHRKTILSFFKDRLQDISKDLDFITSANYMITDEKHNVDKVQSVIGHPISNIKEMTPYNTMIDFGHSLQLHVQNIMVSIDTISTDLLHTMIVHLASYAKENENARIHLLTRNAEYDKKDKTLSFVREVLMQNGFDPRIARMENVNTSEFDLDEEELIPIIFYVDQCIEELSVSKCLKQQRLLVDVSSKPDLFLQIACISTGIPQIIQVDSQYVQHKKNGLILQTIDELEDALHYYLDGLQNWNDAKVYAYELGKEYTTQRLIEKWKEVIEYIGSN